MKSPEWLQHPKCGHGLDGHENGSEVMRGLEGFGFDWAAYDARVLEAWRKRPLLDRLKEWADLYKSAGSPLLWSDLLEAAEAIKRTNSMKPDVLDQLKAAMRYGTADSDINALVRPVPIDVLEAAIREIEFLRSRAGAVTQGESFDDIRRRQGKQEQE